MQKKNTTKLAIKKDLIVNIITTDGKTLSGKIKNFSRHSSGAVYLEINKGASDEK